MKRNRTTKKKEREREIAKWFALRGKPQNKRRKYTNKYCNKVSNKKKGKANEKKLFFLFHFAFLAFNLCFFLLLLCLFVSTNFIANKLEEKEIKQNANSRLSFLWKTTQKQEEFTTTHNYNKQKWLWIVRRGQKSSFDGFNFILFSLNWNHMIFLSSSYSLELI